MLHNSPALTLFAQADSLEGHRIRLVLAEKGVVGYSTVAVNDFNEDLAAINPYHTTPTLVDRELVLYEPRTILEYIDERYPQPALMPVDPAQRARYRTAMRRFEHELYEPGEDIDCAGPSPRKARKHMQEALARLASDALPRKTLGEDYSLLDCTLAPVLWRLDHYRLKLPERQDRAIREYAHGLFRRKAFADSLSASEADMRRRVAC